MGWKRRLAASWMAVILVPVAAHARIADGAVLYALNCAQCHGPTGRGDGVDAELFATRPRDLHDGVLARYPNEALVERIRRGTRLALDPAAVRARATDTEALVRHLERLPRVDWRLVERGEEIFVDRCEICHGAFGRPTGVPPAGVARPTDLSADEFQRRVGDPQVAEMIRRGHGAMPGLLPRVELADVPAVAAFVRLLSPGFERYERMCAPCHGEDGRGAGVRYGDTGVRVPTVVFDAGYFARTDPEHVRAAAWHMLDERRPEMPHLGRTLAVADARAIVEYLKRTQ